MDDVYADKRGDERISHTIKPHRKTRTGCTTCKARKVKCDEVRPICGNCSARFRNTQSCKFILSKSSSAIGRSRSPRRPSPESPKYYESPQNALVVRPRGFSESSSTRILELKLFHHYTTATAAFLPLSREPLVRLMWTVEVPQASFESDYLLNIVLATGALHLARLTPNDLYLVPAAHRYFGKSLVTHQYLVSLGDSGIAIPQMFTAILIIPLTRLLTRSNSSFEPYRLPIQDFYLSRGVRDLILANLPWIKGSNVYKFIHAHLGYGFLFSLANSENGSSQLQQSLHDTTVEIESSGTTMNISNPTYLLKGLPKDRQSSPNINLYENLVNFLLIIRAKLIAGVSLAQLQRRLVVMPFLVDIKYIELLEEKDARAMAILAYYYGLMDRLTDGVWWLEGISEYEINGINQLMPPGWEWAMEWPLQTISKDAFRPHDPQLSPAFRIVNKTSTA